MTRAGPVVAVESLTKRFGDTVAVDDLTFQAEPGRVTGFLGPNGAGKTTTMRMLLGLVRPTSGAATIDGQPFGRLSQPLRVVGATLDAGGFHPGRTAANHLKVHCQQGGIPLSVVDMTLEQVGLSDVADRRVGTFSLGMRQRLGLATALSADPHALLLDEPANGLDPQGIAWLRGFLTWLASQGRTIVVSSHLLAEMAQIADDVVIIDRGQLVRAAPLADLLAGFSSTVTVSSPQRDDLQVALATEGLHGRVVDSTTLEVEGATASTVGELAARGGLIVHRLLDEKPDLERAFLELVAQHRVELA